MSDGDKQDDQRNAKDLTDLVSLMRPNDSPLSDETQTPDDVVERLTGLSLDMDLAGDPGYLDQELPLSGAEGLNQIDLQNSEEEAPEVLLGASPLGQIDLSVGSENEESTALFHPEKSESIDLSAEGDFVFPENSTEMSLPELPEATSLNLKTEGLSPHPSQSDSDEAFEPVHLVEEKLDFLQQEPDPVQDKHADLLEDIRSFAEKAPIGEPQVSASFPFSVLITGQLSQSDQARLLDVVLSNQMGFEEKDLKSQIESGKMLIPRISEYAAVLIIQTLRDSGADIRMGPADQIFSSKLNDGDQTDDDPIPTARSREIYSSESVANEADKLPLLTGVNIPGVQKRWKIIDTVTASATLKTSLVEAQRSQEYQDLVERLQTELKFKAYLKGASAVIKFNISLTPLLTSTHYRLMAMGTAVKYI